MTKEHNIKITQNQISNNKIKSIRAREEEIIEKINSIHHRPLMGL